MATGRVRTPPNSPQKWPLWADGFFRALAKRGIVADACQAVGIDRSRAYQVRRDNPTSKGGLTFGEHWDKALQHAADLVEAEMHRRAVDGVTEPVFHQGVVVGAVRKYSDGLLGKLAAAHKPERFRERVAVDVNASELAAEAIRALAGEKKEGDKDADPNL